MKMYETPSATRSAIQGIVMKELEILKTRFLPKHVKNRFVTMTFRFDVGWESWTVRVARAGKVQRISFVYNFRARTTRRFPHLNPFTLHIENYFAVAFTHRNTVKLAKLTESPSGMGPPSPSKFPMSPGMPIFPVSPERAAGTKPPYGAPAAHSPSLPDLRTSPLRKHRRNDSDVSVQGLAAMFENLEVKDFKEAQAKYMNALQKQTTKHANEIRQLEKQHALDTSRRLVRIEELESELSRWTASHKDCTSRETWEKNRQDQRAAIAKWEKAMKAVEEHKLQMSNNLVSATTRSGSQVKLTSGSDKDGPFCRRI